MMTHPKPGEPWPTTPEMCPKCGHKFANYDPCLKRYRCYGVNCNWAELSDLDRFRESRRQPTNTEGSP